MSFDYAEIAAVATELLTEFGQQVTVSNVVVGAYDPATGTSATTTSNVTRNGALFDFGEGETLGPGGLIERGDKKLLLGAGVVPSIEDVILVGAAQYVIKGVGETNPAGTPVMYTLHLRRG